MNKILTADVKACNFYVGRNIQQSCSATERTLKTTEERIAWIAIRRGNGGAGRNRTADLRIANATLSQLSYGPTSTSTCRERAAYDSRLMPVANPPDDNSFAGPAASARSTGSPGRQEILIFAKAPRPGQCKTRLARRLGATRAARIYRQLLDTAVAQACAVEGAHVTLVCAPDTAHPVFARLARRYGVDRRRQSRGPLGRRMHCALRDACQHNQAVILVGSDQPTDIAAFIQTGLDQLRRHDAWLAPTLDGGYWAIGLRRPDSRVFRGPAWSTSRVAGHTMTLLSRPGRSAACAAVRRDIDDARDWFYLPRSRRADIARRATLPGSRYRR